MTDLQPKESSYEISDISLLLAGGFIALSTIDASAVVCARGVYRAGCVATGGAAVVARPAVRPAAGLLLSRREGSLFGAGCTDALA
jgi:hypothetical protein